jgi:ribosome biogenesis GTPase
MISRQAVGKTGQMQIIATNIDFGLVIQAVDRDFNINRMERYLTICYDSKVTPIIVLSKIDLISDSELESIKNQIAERIKNIQVISISNETGFGHADLKSIIYTGKTYCLLGSSGVGKSSLLNMLTGRNLMQTGTISSSNNKGRHITSHRELVVLESGGIFIDNPGMREVGLTDSSEGLEITFDDINSLAYDCKFKDCTHTSEKGCAILEAIDEGRVDQDSYFNFQKLQKEQMHYESTVLEKKKKDKDLGKIIKTFKKNRNQNKY